MILNEDPDMLGVKIGGEKPDYSDSDAVAFGFKKGVAYLGKLRKRTTHPDLIINNDNLFKLALSDSKLKKFFVSPSGDPVSKKRAYLNLVNDWEAVEAVRKFLDYAGRIWVDRKVISFWEFPHKNEFYRLTSELNKQANGFKIDKTWKVEVLNDKDKEVLVPFDAYSGEKLSNKKFDMSKLHTMTPKEKSKVMKDMGIKSGDSKAKLPAGMTMAQFRSLTRQEGFNFKKYYEILKEAEKQHGK